MNTENLDILKRERDDEDDEDENDEEDTSSNDEEHKEDIARDTFDEDRMDPWNYDRNSPPCVVPVELLPKLVQMANSEDDKEVFQGVLLIRKLLAGESNPPIQKVIDSGVVLKLVQSMQHPNHELQFEASWALCNIAAGNSDHTDYIISLRVVPLWVSHLSHHCTNCVEQATWAIGNIAGAGASGRDIALEAGAMPLLQNVIENCSDEHQDLMKSAVWALSNLCRFEPQPAIAHVVPVVPLLVRLCEYPDPEVVLDALWALSFICNGSQEQVKLIVDNGGVTSIVKLLDTKKRSFHVPAIRIIAHICSFASLATGGTSDLIFNLMIKCGVVETLYTAELVSSINKAVAKASLEVILTIISYADYPINVVSKSGRSPLHLAACYGHVAAMIALIVKGVALEAADDNGDTPLHTAARNSRVLAIETLVAEGADRVAANNFNQTPICLFKSQGLPEDTVTRVEQLLNPK